MKNIENSKTWNLVISVIDKVIAQNISTKENKDIIREKCSKLALYSYKADVETGKVTEHELLKMEREGKIFGISLLNRIIRHYYILSKMQDLDCSKQLQLLTNLNAYLGNQFYYKVEGDIIEQLLICGLMLPDFSIDMPQAQLDRMIESAKLLKGYNINPEIEYGGFSCSDDNSQKLFDLIEQKIKAIGGNYVLGKVFDEFFNQHIPIFDLYNILRNSKDERNEPRNILLNLSIKHLRANIRYSDLTLIETKVDEVFQIARAWLDVLDIQSESGMEYSMMRVEKFPLYFSNEIIFDKMCMPKQYNKKYILLLLEHLIKPFFDKAEKKYSFKEYYCIAEYLMMLEQPYLFLNLDEIHRKTRVANYKIKLILEDISKPIKEVNSKFNSLEGEVDFYTRPLIRFPFEKYLYIDYHFTGFGFYLSAYDMIKAKFNILDRKLGPLVENMLRAEVSKKGYSLCNGKYTTQDDESDCDMVMQDPNRICFIEVKKTEIEDEFNKLDDVAALQQLSKGMIKAQKQAFRHKKNLLKNKKLLLKNEQNEAELSYLGNENIYMFSICLPEYSFITSKNFSSKLLEVILLGGFSTVDPNRQCEVKELNELGKTMLQYATEIYNGSPIDVHSLSFYSAFASAQQLLTALWCSNSQDEFLEIIRNWIYGTDGTLNLYHSILLDVATRNNPQSIRKSAIDMLENAKKEAVFLGWDI